MNNELDKYQKKLVLEHARLAVKFSKDDSVAKRLAEIEVELKMSPKEIATIVLAIYKQTYK
ncbi:MAG: hypothetical protein KBC78_00840 [Candidatus Pacebacteria bacterium]|nr:hypothetical protein [Candidatus Paceibacterota bacterium]